MVVTDPVPFSLSDQVLGVTQYAMNFTVTTSGDVIELFVNGTQDSILLDVLNIDTGIQGFVSSNDFDGQVFRVPSCNGRNINGTIFITVSCADTSVRCVFALLVQTQGNLSVFY